MDYIQNAKQEIQAMHYETLLKRGFTYDRRISRANKQEFINLVRTERGHHCSFLGSYESQYKDCLYRISKSLELILANQSLSVQQRENLVILKDKLPYCRDSQDIAKVVNASLDSSRI